MTVIRFLILLLFILSWGKVQAQDPQFSQFYANQLYLNPAFTGASGGLRAGFSYRMQWPKLGTTFNTSSFGMDFYCDKLNSGIGLLVVSNQISETVLNSTDLSLLYAYNLQLSDDFYFRAGFQGTYGTRSLDFSSLIFTDQLSDNGLTTNTSGENFSTDNIGFVGVSSGGLLYSDRFWLGFSFHHMNQPRQSFLDDGLSRLPMKYSVHAGYKILLHSETYRNFGSRDRQGYDVREISITPAFNYKAQAQFDQLDVGISFNYSPIVLGVWYRGLPVKSFESSIINQDAIITSFGIQYSRMSFGYSYDFTISDIAADTGGVHEISLAYVFPVECGSKRGRKKIKRTGLPCPRF